MEPRPQPRHEARARISHPPKVIIPASG
jgi:hypothetical protein